MGAAGQILIMLRDDITQLDDETAMATIMKKLKKVPRSDQNVVGGCFLSRKLIAFRTIDFEGDIWCEKTFLFENEEAVRLYFRKDNPDLIRIFAQEPPGNIKNLKIHDDNRRKIVNAVEFYTKYAGEVKIARMSGGYVVDFDSQKTKI